MPLETEPKNPHPEGYIPPGGREYPVKDRDSFWSIAKANGLDVWALIEFNFNTRNPREVNWYLRHRVGCKLPSADGLNWCFSAAAKPGKIYLPPVAAAPPQKAAEKPPPSPLDYKALGIDIDGDAEYTRRVRFVLDWIARSDSGNAFIKAMGSTGKKMTIRPFVPDGSCTPDTRNAYAKPKDWPGATSKGDWIYKNDNSKTARDERFDPVMEPGLVRRLLGLPPEPVVGTGTGSDVIVAFSPEMWGHGNVCASPGGEPGSSPSEVLFHEFVHAYRQLRGRLRMFPTSGGRRQYDNEEEFLAVVVSNVFVSDPTNPNGPRMLRSDHWGFAALPVAQATTKGFLAVPQNRRLVRKLATEEPDLVDALKAIPGPFNPFSEM